MISQTNALIMVLIHGVIGIPGPIDWMQDLADQKYPEVKAPFRVEAHIIRFDNPRGTTKNWMPCDFFSGSCDPKITGVIDYHTPNYDFGKVTITGIALKNSAAKFFLQDSVPYDRFVTLWEGSSQNNINIDKVMIKDVCGAHSTRKINVRVRAVDKDVLRDDTIDRWSCFIYTTDPPAENERSAQWSEEKVCSGHNSAHTITWRYKWYRIADSDCQETDGSSGFLRRVIPFIGK